jgi:hypothetical protein
MRCTPAMATSTSRPSSPTWMRTCRFSNWRATPSGSSSGRNRTRNAACSTSYYRTAPGRRRGGRHLPPTIDGRRRHEGWGRGERWADLDDVYVSIVGGSEDAAPEAHDEFKRRQEDPTSLRGTLTLASQRSPPMQSVCSFRLSSTISPTRTPATSQSIGHGTSRLQAIWKCREHSRCRFIEPSGLGPRSRSENGAEIGLEVIRCTRPKTCRPRLRQALTTWRWASCIHSVSCCRRSSPLRHGFQLGDGRHQRQPFALLSAE